MNGRKRNLWKRGRRLLTVLLALALAVTYLPAETLTAQATAISEQEAESMPETETTPEAETETAQSDGETSTLPAEIVEPEEEKTDANPEEVPVDNTSAENSGTVSAENDSELTEEEPDAESEEEPDAESEEESDEASEGNEESVSEEESAVPAGEKPDSVSTEDSGITPEAGEQEFTPGAGLTAMYGIATMAEIQENDTTNTTLVTDGDAVMWDFRIKNAQIYSGSDGSLSVNTSLDYNGSQHGAIIKDGTVFTLTVPGGLTTIKLGICQYSNESLTATIKDQQDTIKDALSLRGSDDEQEISVEYMADEATALTIEMSGSGQAYLHYIEAETIDPARIATVSGQVTVDPSASSVAGEPLIFTGSDGEKTKVVIGGDGSYTVSLSVGQNYTVVFENADVYKITSGDSLVLSNDMGNTTVTHNISCQVIWDISKSFSFGINGTTFTVKPGSSSSEDFEVTTEGDGSGSVELATADTAIIWADLEGAGIGNLMSDTIQNVNGNVTYTISGNTIKFTYTDTATSPNQYTIQVKDNSAPGEPSANGQTISYDFGDGSIVSELYTGNYDISGGKTVKSADGLVMLTGINKITYNGSHGIMINNGDQISVKVAGNAQIALELCSYTTENSTIDVIAEDGQITPQSVSAQAATDGASAAFEYEGEATTLTFTYNGSGSGYIHSMEVTNEQAETIVHEQTEMPEVSGEGAEVSAAGQRLTLTQTGGSLKTEDVPSGIGYYGFDLTADMNRIEADVIATSGGSSSANGIFFGAYDENGYIASIGIRNSTNLRGVYSHDGAVLGAGGPNLTITEGQTVHFTAEKTESGFVIEATPKGGETVSLTCPYNSGSYTLFAEDGAETDISFGFILANASATVTNMKYYSESNEILYDQNNCYDPIGREPVVNRVQAVSSDTRDAIIITWNSSVLADGDGRYVLQVRKDNGEWQDVAETTDTSYTYPVAEEGTYEFRVGGKLGSQGEVTYCEQTVTVENFIPALPTPTLTATAAADTSSIQLAWTPSEGAVSYELYKYSSDQGAEGAVLLATVSETSYTDTAVELEVPYYYYVIAKSAGNSSNPSETVWTVVSAGHTGDYAYEDEAAVITITGCPNSTIFQSAVTISGTVDRAGMMRAFVNDASLTTAAAEQQVTAGGNFTLNLQLAQGRNDVRLIFTDENGTETCLTYNFVYLNSSEINMIVDASYEGEDGANVDGIPAYSTVQAAVNAAAQNASVQRSAERTVIFIKNGDYEERLVVSAPNISLIGESEEGVRIHCYPANLYPDDSGYEAGGDMNLRCATYITSDAAGFSAENMTFANDYEYGTNDGKTNKSADALRCDADGASFVNVTFSGVQDTLYIGDGNVYFYKCRIEGLIDFIYSGDTAKALFEDCEIVFVYEETHPEGGYVCAPRTEANSGNGLFFYDCSVTSEPGCEEGTFHLARPWGPDAVIYWINCYLGSAINADEPYADMSGNSFMEANFYEYGSYGLGYKVNEYRKQISPSEAKELLEIAVSTLGAAYIGNISNDIAAGKLEPQHPETDVPSDVPEGGNEGENTGNAGDTGNGGQTGDNVNTGDTGSNGQTGNSSNSGNSGHTGSGSSSGTSGSGSDSSSAAQSAVVQNTVTSTTSASATTVTSAADDADTDVETVEGTPDDYALEEVEEETENAAEGEESTAVIDEEETPLGSQQIRGLRSILPWLIIPVALIIAGIFGWNVYKRKNESED